MSLAFTIRFLVLIVGASIIGCSTPGAAENPRGAPEKPRSDVPVERYGDALRVYIDSARGVACYTVPELNNGGIQQAAPFSCVKVR